MCFTLTSLQKAGFNPPISKDLRGFFKQNEMPRRDDSGIVTITASQNPNHRLTAPLGPAENSGIALADSFVR